MALNDCIDKAKAALPTFSGRELRNYVSQVYSKAKEKGIPKALLKSSLKEITDEINESTIARYNELAQIKLNNIAKVSDLKNDIKNGKANVRELMGHTNRSLAKNIESYQKFDHQLLSDIAYGPLDPRDISYFVKSENDEEVSKCLDGGRGSPEAQKIADTIKNQYIPRRNANMVKSNAMLSMDLNEDRFLGNNHNVSKMVSGGRSLIKRAMSKFTKEEPFDAKERWVKFISSKLDLEDTFKNTDLDQGFWQLDTAQSEPELKLDMEKVNDFLRNTYDNITTGKTEMLTRSSATSDLDAIEKKSHQFFKFKDYKAWNEYNKEYGTGSMFTALKMDINASGSRSGMAKLVGDNAQSAYTALKKYQINMKNKPKKGPMKKRGSLWWWNTGNMFNDRIGVHRSVVSPSLAHFIGNLNSYTQMARLGALLPQSLTDTNMAASYARRCGDSYLSAFIKQWKNIATQYSDEDMKNMAMLMHKDIENHIGYIGKFSDGENLGALTSKVSALYFKYNFMHGWDSGNKSGIMLQQALSLGQNADKSFSELNIAKQHMLNKFGITSPEWDVLRANVDHGYITTDAAAKMSDDQAKDLQSKLNLDEDLTDTKNNLYRKLYSYFDVASENAILTPGTFERAIMLHGTQPGTPGGSFARLVMQFKGWPLAYINRQLINGFKDADATQSKLGWAFTTFGAVLPLSLLSTALYYISQGQTPPDPSQMDAQQSIDFWSSQAMPGLGIMSSILDPENQNKNLAASLMLTPNWRVLNDAIGAPLATATGTPHEGAKDLEEALRYAVPGMTIPVLGPYMREVLGENPYLQPGQSQLYGA